MRLHYLYLKNAYECALQYMNKFTWKQCITMAIDKLSDTGINNIRNEKTIRLLHRQFRDNDVLSIPHMIPKAEPFAFSFFDELKPSIISFCNNAILEGNLSTEVLLTEVKQNIKPQCYNSLVNDTPEDDRENIVEYDNILQQLH